MNFTRLVIQVVTVIYIIFGEFGLFRNERFQSPVFFPYVFVSNLDAVRI